MHVAWDSMISCVNNLNINAKTMHPRTPPGSIFQDLNLFTKVSAKKNGNLNLFTKVSAKKNGKNWRINARDISWLISWYLAIVAALFRIASWALASAAACSHTANYSSRNHCKHQPTQFLQYQMLPLKRQTKTNVSQIYIENLFLEFLGRATFKGATISL